MKYQKTIVAIIFTFSSLLFYSCQEEIEPRTRRMEINELAEYLEENNITTNPTWTGLYFLEDSIGTGLQPEFNDTIVLEYTASLLNGIVLGSSALDGIPFTVNLWDWGLIHGISEAASYLKVGGKARAIVPSPLAFDGYSSGVIKPYSTLIYDLRLIEVRPGIQVEPFPTADSILHTTTSGLQYYTVMQTDGELVGAGRTVSVHYTAYLPDGKIFDSSVKRGDDANFTVGVGALISGFDEGLMLMKEGEKFRLIIPPDLGYGEDGNFPVVPPGATLTFDIELLDIQG